MRPITAANLVHYIMNLRLKYQYLAFYGFLRWYASVDWKYGYEEVVEQYQHLCCYGNCNMGFHLMRIPAVVSDVEHCQVKFPHLKTGIPKFGWDACKIRKSSSEAH